ncbi:TPA: restriction endonuclease subunit S [Vibrio diabolicus]
MTEQMNVPKLRFGEFDGEWQKLTLKQVSSKSISYGVVQTGDKDLTVPCVRVVDLTSGSLNRETFIKTSEAINQSYKKTILESGELMVALRGVIGLTRAVPVDLVGCNLTRGIARISPDQKRFSSQFIEQALNTPKSSQRFDQLKNGSALKEISIGELNKYSTDYPHLPEQQKIASFLSKVDEKIALLTEKKDKLTEYKKGVMQQLFNGKWQEQDGQLTFIPPTLRFKADDGSEFPDWEERTIVSLFPQIRNGFVGTATPFYASSDNGVKYLQGKNIKKNRIDDSGLIYVNNNFHVKNTKSQLKVDDIVMVQSGHVGECARITKEFDGANCHALLVASPNLEKVNSSYFVYYFYSPIGKAQTYKITTGNTIKHILGSDLKDIKVNAPSLSEQTKIANFLSAIDQKIDLANSELEKAKEWKKGLLQQMFV